MHQDTSGKAGHGARFAQLAARQLAHRKLVKAGKNPRTPPWLLSWHQGSDEILSESIGITRIQITQKNARRFGGQTLRKHQKCVNRTPLHAVIEEIVFNEDISARLNLLITQN
jgi:hypothetical protein